jgi:putative transcriptional regulator
MEGGFFTGQLLIAMPGISDPRFDRAVILICAHDSEHAMGLALNRPVEGLTIPDLLERLQIEGQARLAPDLVLMGGPVERERGFVLHTDDYESEHGLRVGGGVTLTATREVLETMAGEDGRPARRLLALGYAGWGPSQLENELKHNVWLACEPDLELIFDHDYAGKWRRALAKLGVDPFRLGPAAGRA